MTARYGTRSVSPIDWARRQLGRTMSNGRGIMGEAVDFVIAPGVGELDRDLIGQFGVLAACLVEGRLAILTEQGVGVRKGGGN